MLLALPLLGLAACGVSRLPDAGAPFTTPGAQPPTATAVATGTTGTATAGTGGSTPSAGSTPTAATTANGCAITPAQTQAEAYVLTLVNQHRAAAGARPLSLDPTLSLAARGHSCDMALHDILSHTGSDGSTPGDRIAAVGLRFTQWGENIGRAGAGDVLGGIAQLDAAMMAEPLTHGNHHWNIVNPAYTQLGAGVIVSGGQVWLTEDFGG